MDISICAINWEPSVSLTADQCRVRTFLHRGRLYHTDTQTCNYLPPIEDLQDNPRLIDDPGILNKQIDLEQEWIKRREEIRASTFLFGRGLREDLD